VGDFRRWLISLIIQRKNSDQTSFGGENSDFLTPLAVE